MYLKRMIKSLVIKVINLGCNRPMITLLQNEFLLKKRINRYKMVKSIYPNMKFLWFWKDNIEELKSVQEETIICSFVCLSDEPKYYLTKLLYYSGKYNDRIAHMVLRFAKETNRADFRYWITMDISRFTFHLQKGFYPDYYLERKNLLKQICYDLELIKPAKSEHSNKLCIITMLLNGDIHNSVTRVAMMVSKGLIFEFEEICIFPLDTFTPVGSEKKTLTTVLPYGASIKTESDIKKLLPIGVKVHYPEGRTYQEKAQDVLDAIYAFNPYVILDMSDEYSAISYFYFKDFYTCYLPLRDTNSSSFYSVIVGAPKWKFIESNTLFNSVDISKVREWNFPEYVPPKTHSHSRTALGIPEDTFVLVSIGNNAMCFSEDFVDSICSLIRKNDMVWLLVGQGAPEYLKQKYVELIEQRKVIEHGYESELFSLCSVCDVLVRPNTTGGSGATAIAAMAGLPVAMTKFLCDASRWLGVDYSKIDTYIDLAVYIEQLFLHRDFYKRERDRCMELVRTSVDSKEKWLSLARILKGEE